MFMPNQINTIPVRYFWVNVGLEAGEFNAPAALIVPKDFISIILVHVNTKVIQNISSKCLSAAPCS